MANGEGGSVCKEGTVNYGSGGLGQGKYIGLQEYQGLPLPAGQNWQNETCQV